MGDWSFLFSGFSSSYKSMLGSLPGHYADLVNIFVFSILIALYSIFTWKFYRFISKKDLLDLNLARYNKVSHPFFRKGLAIVLYFAEYIIILPFLIFFWFAVLALVILLLSEELVINQVLIVAASIVAAIRMLSYYEEDLSMDLAKMFPFTMLVIFILSPSFFSLERIITNLSNIPSLVINIYYFLILIVGLEVILRLIDLTVGLLYERDDEQ